MCDFPDCGDDPTTDTGMCDLHAHVRVSSSGSFVPDRHDASSGGEH